MKKVFLFICLFATTLLFAITPQRIEYVSKNPYAANVKWHKAIRTGVTTYFATNDSVLVKGASDSLYSYVYRLEGLADASVQLHLLSGNVGSIGTRSIRCIVQVANGGDLSKKAFNIPDSSFQDMYWLTMPSGLDIVSLSDDSLVTYGRSIPIQLPILDCELVRFMLISSTVHTDTTDFEAMIYIKER